MPEMNVASLQSEEQRQYVAVARDVTERKEAEEKLKQIEWLLDKRVASKASHLMKPAYGDLTEMNSCRLVLDSVGKNTLYDIVGDYLDLLDTSAAVYEKDGSYALGLFTSGWCRYLDHTSRALCGNVNNAEAMESGKWHCHEACWRHASLVSMENGKPVDIECLGGIHLYAVPIRAGGKTAGSINFGYGDPPQDPVKLREIAERYGVRVDELLEQAKAYEPRPPFIINLAKKRLAASARLIGEIIDRKLAEQKVKQSIEKLKMSEKGIISALALTVEQRDPYTAGHQQRVSLLAYAIAVEMGLPEDQI